LRNCLTRKTSAPGADADTRYRNGFAVDFALKALAPRVAHAALIAKSRVLCRVRAELAGLID
jgi:hypothetical protein